MPVPEGQRRALVGGGQSCCRVGVQRRKTGIDAQGKRRSTRVRKGAPWLKTTLVTAAWAAVRTKGSYLQAQFLRIKSRRGAKKAILAVAASMLTAAYFMLRDRVPYKDLGADHFSRHDKTKTIQRLLRRLSDLGCTVATAQPA